MALQPEAPVLIASDDAELVGRLREALRDEDFPVVCGRTVRGAMEALDFHRPAVVVLDLAFEAGRGWELLHALAGRAGTSVLALERHGDALARRAALAAGAADLAGPPLEPTEIALRSRALHRRERNGHSNGSVLRHEDLVMDLASHEVRVAGHTVTLTPQQFAILRALLEARGATLHRSQLLARIAAVDDEPPSDRAVDLHVSRLRRRLRSHGGSGRYIEAVYGIGYRVALAAGPAAVPAEVAGRVLDAVTEGVLVVDADLRIVAANRAAARLLERDDLVGRSCPEVTECRTVGGVPLSGPACLGRAALSGGGTILHVPACVRADGRAMLIDLSHTAIPVDGGPDLVAIEFQRKGG